MKESTSWYTQLEKLACYAYDMYPEMEVLVVNLSFSVWENARQERSTELEDNHWHKSGQLQSGRGILIRAMRY